MVAVALSHRLELPLLTQPQPGCLVVDDVYETGRTLAPYRDLRGNAAGVDQQGRTAVVAGVGGLFLGGMDRVSLGERRAGGG